MVQNAIKNLFIGIAPEKDAVLRKLWEDYSPRFNIMEDSGDDGFFVMEAGGYRDVRFNQRALRVFWFATFVAWEGYSAFAKGYEGKNIDLSKFKSMIAILINMMRTDAVEMPSGIPEPGILPDKNIYPEQRAAAELAMFAAGWALLHEVQHIMHQQAGTSASPSCPSEKQHAEEFSCDAFATKVLLDNVNEYATAVNEPIDKVRAKRETGIYMALYALTLVSFNKWNASDSHPSIQDRINAVHMEIEAEDSHYSYLVAVMAFNSLQKVWPDTPGLFDLPDIQNTTKT